MPSRICHSGCSVASFAMYPMIRTSAMTRKKPSKNEIADQPASRRRLRMNPTVIRTAYESVTNRLLITESTASATIGLKSTVGVRNSGIARNSSRYGSVRRAIRLPHFVCARDGTHEKKMRTAHSSIYTEITTLTMRARAVNIMENPPQICSLFQDQYLLY